MKAFVYDLARRPELMSFANFAAAPSEAALKNGEVLIKVHAAALNPVDYKKPALIPLAGYVLGGTAVAQDYSGVVVATKGPTGLAVGDEVFGTNSGGCLAEYLATPAATCRKKPARLSHAEAASLVTVAQTTLQSFSGGGHARPLRAGESVLVVGASGGCGLAGVQIARALVGREGRVVGISSAESAPLVEALGATDALVDYKAGAEALVAALQRHAPFDTIYDTVSSFEAYDTVEGKSYVEVLKPLLKPTGCHVAINGSAGQWVGAFVGWQARNYRLLMQSPSGADLEATVRLVEEGKLKPVLDSVHPFTPAGCDSAYARLRSRRSRGKVVVELVGQ
jgi:NADPH:quinone reductase-like Zn-dependent oxidoreductase